MPSACDARSSPYIARAEASATDCGSLMTSELAAGEFWIALFGEGSDAFRVVLRTAELALEVAFLIERLLERPAPRLVDRLLRARQTARRRKRQLLRERVDRLLELAIFEAAPDQAPLRRLLRRQLVRQQGEAHRSRVAEQPRQQPRAAGIRHEAEFAEGLNEARRAGREHEITRQRDVCASAGGDAIDCSDDRHRQIAQREHERLVVLVDRLAEIDALPARRDGAVAEILAGAETTARAREHEYTCGAVCRQLAQCVAHFTVHLDVETVQAVRPIQRQTRDAIAHVEQNGLVAHVSARRK